MKGKGKKVSKKKALDIFINPRSDFGFKKVFNNPKMMMSFLNELIPRKVKDFQITSVTYLPVEHLGENEEEHRIIVDSRCKTNSGEDILVEMQNARPMNFFERLIYYCLYLLRNQLPTRKRKTKKSKQTKNKIPAWNYEMNPVYVVAIVNFPMIKGKDSKNVIIDWIRLKSEETGQTSSYKLNFIIVDLTKFNKKREELNTKADFWLYTLKWAETLEERPVEINDDLFIDLYDNILRTNKLTPEEMKAYSDSVLDMKNLGLFTSYAEKKGIVKGEKRGEKRGIEIGEKRGEKRGIEIGEKRGEKRGIEIGEKRGIEVGEERAYIQIIQNAANKGMSIEAISEFTNLSQEQICEILKRKK